MDELKELRKKITELEGLKAQYIEAQKTLQSKSKMEELVSGLSNKFINTSLHEIDKEINRSLEIIGKQVGADRCYTYFFTEDLKGIKYGYEWCREGVEPGIEKISSMNYTQFTWAIEKLKNLKDLYIIDNSLLPPEAEKEKKLIWEPFNIKSFLTIPLSLKKNLIGFFGFHTVKEERHWKEEDIRLLKIVGGIFVNILERKRVDKALKESQEEKYRRIFNHIRDVYYEVDLEGNILEISPSVEEISKYKRKDLLGTSLYEIYANPEDRDKAIKEIKTKGRVIDYEILLKDKDGREVSCSISSKLVVDKEKNSARLIGSLKDITEQKFAEESLKNRILIEKLVSDISTRFISINTSEVDREIKWALRSIGEFVGVDRCYIYLFSKDLVRIEKKYEWNINKRKKREPDKIPLNSFSWSMDQLKKFSYISISNIDNLPPEAEFEKKLWQSRNIKSVFSIALKLRNTLTGEFGFATEIKEKKFRKEGVHLLKLVGEIFVNIFERKKIEEEKEKIQAQLIQTQKMEALGVLAGGIAHDFNNILASIMGYTEMSMRYVKEGSPVWHNLEYALRSINRATDLVKQILTYSRHSEQELRPVNLSFIIKEVIKFIRATIPSTIEIRKHIKIGSAMTMGNSTQIYQVLINLCTNAYHAMRDFGGIMEIILSPAEIEEREDHPEIPPGSYIKLTIKDTGHGMEEKIISRIFDPFFTTKKRGKGTGMGLSVVHGIVKNHNGFINVSSRPGEGSCFDVYFPRIDSQEIKKVEVIKDLDLGNEKILFVDDEKELVDLTIKMLSSFGYYVTGTTSSLEALEIFNKNPKNFDIIVTDLTMPHITGIELAKKLLSIQPDIPIILCTGYGDKVTRKEIRKIGIKEILMKPVYMKQLSEIIRDTLDREKA